MLGTSHNLKRFSASTDLFLINRQHEDVYDADDGTMEYKGPSRAYGWEAKTSVQVTPLLSWNAGITQVSNAFYLGTKPREYVDSAPHTVANSSLTLSAWHGVFSSVRYRHISGYLVVNPDALVDSAGNPVTAAWPYTDPAKTHAGGLDVMDFAVSTRVRHGVEWNLSVDNLNNKHYYETQNYHNSRITPTSPVEVRIHGTPGYSIRFTTGLTLRFE
jgi:outer membrane receptor protein involved in Fe transport